MLVVYDFSEDSTLETAKPISEHDPRVKLIPNPERGALGAIKTGFKNAENEAILTVMADDPLGILSKIDEMTRRFYDEKATIVVASRYMPGGKSEGGHLLKGLMSRFAGISLHLLIHLPTHDATYATRLYKKSFLKKITIESQRGFELALEITLKAYLAGEKIIEVPVEWRERTKGESKFQVLKWLPAYLYWYWYALRGYYFGNQTKK